MKKTISLILSVLMILSSFSIITTISAKETNVASTGAANSGTTGDCTWTFDDDTETLTISGNGDMGYYEYNDEQKNLAPWKDFLSLIKNVNINEGVKKIGSYAFCDCTNLVSVTLPESLTYISWGVFDNTNLKDIYYNGNEDQWSFVALSDYTILNLKTFTIHYGKNTVTGTTGQCEWILDRDSCILTVYGKGKMSNEMPPWRSYQDLIKKVIIKDGVTSIGDYAFYKCSNLDVIEIPNSVVSIGFSSFYSCENLINIAIPDSVVSINALAFSNCTNLKNISIPKGITKIGAETFENCASMVSVTIPDGLNTIGWKAFYNCKSMTSVSIPNSVTSIGEEAFENCICLQEITLSNSLKSIEGDTFSGCTSLRNITIPNGVTSIGYDAFYMCSSLTSVIIPETVLSIGNCAFKKCNNMQDVTIPNSVINIDSNIFDDCENLKNIYFSGNKRQ